MPDPGDPTGPAAPPPAVVPPRGLLGILDDYDPTATLDTSEFSPCQVFLNVYDLGDDDTFRQINLLSTANNNLLIGGVFHGGVEVYGNEWSYGFNEDVRSGVQRFAPRSHTQHSYRTTVPLGTTKLCEPEVEAILERLTEEWPGNEYHFIERNCLSFCNALCQELGVGRIPGWVDRAQRLADGAYQTAKLARAVSAEVVGAMPEVEETVRSMLPEVSDVDTQDAQRMAEEAVQSFRRESLKAMEAVSTQTQELAEATQAQAQVLSEAVQANAQVLGERAQELLGDDIPLRAQELSDRTQEQARALGSSLWQWGQDLQKVATRVLREDSDAQGRVNDLWDTALLGGLLGGSSEPSRRPDLARRRESRKKKIEERERRSHLLLQEDWSHSELLQRAPVPERPAATGELWQAESACEETTSLVPPAAEPVAEASTAAGRPACAARQEPAVAADEQE